MCLQKIDKTFDKPLNNILGYKIFIKHEITEYESLFMAGGIYQLKKWYNARNCPITSGSSWYLSGFHCIKTRKEAREFLKVRKQWFGRKFVIVKIIMSGIHTFGPDGNYTKPRTYVCQKMKLLKEVR